MESAKSLSIILLIFALTTSVFIGMGQYIGNLFERFTPLKAYSINVAGALAGSLLFTLLCSLETPPGLWIALAGLLLMLVRMSPAAVGIVVFGFAHLFLVPFIAGKYYGSSYVTTLWSPYYRIDVVEARGPDNKKWGYDLKVNYDTFQTILDCSPANLASFSPAVQKGMLAAFAHPYECLRIRPKKVLILASGNGCDVAAALRNGAEHVDAVDIDPVLTRLGKTMHPEKPYLDPRVNLYVMDARTYLKNCKEKYDLILFAYLDSHTAFSSLSSLRTDNYIFTVESYKEAVRLLNDKGIVFVDFISFKPWLWNRHTNALAAASNMIPIASYSPAATVGTGSMASGAGINFLDRTSIRMPGELREVNTNSGTILATDDWPFLFMPSRELTWTYALPLLMVLSFSAIFVARELRTGVKESSNWLMLFMGMGFMLLEVRAMADLSLMFGSTWLVNATVISTVLLMILGGNFVAQFLKIGQAWICALVLIATVFATTMFKPADLLSLGSSGSVLAGAILYLLPAAVAAVLFALLFKQVAKPSTALAFNIFGGLVGVSLEYLSMLYGVRSLGWIAMLIYGVALAILTFGKPRVQPVVTALLVVTLSVGMSGCAQQKADSPTPVAAGGRSERQGKVLSLEEKTKLMKQTSDLLLKEKCSDCERLAEGLTFADAEFVLDLAATCYEGKNDIASAERLRKAMMDPRFPMSRDPNLMSQPIGAYGAFLCRTHREAEGEKLLKRAITLAEHNQPGPGMLPAHLTDLADCYDGQGRHTEADLLYIRAIKLDPDSFSSGMEVLADTGFDDQLKPTGEPVYKRLIGLMKRAGAENAHLAGLYLKLAKVQNECGKQKEAISSYREGLRILDKTPPQRLEFAFTDYADTLGPYITILKSQHKQAEAAAVERRIAAYEQNSK
jgi:tetratricopeptide (TPR) repeat protein